jgi:hypothetical protein
MQFLQTLPVRRYPHRAFAAERAPPGANAQIALEKLAERARHSRLGDPPIGLASKCFSRTGVSFPRFFTFHRATPMQRSTADF